MNRIQKRLKRRFVKNKKKAIRKVIKKTYLALVAIKSSDFNDYTKEVLILLSTANGRYNTSIIAAFMYNPSFEREGIEHARNT